jgi:signal peptide peptidase SppA
MTWNNAGILRAIAATPWAIVPEKLDAIVDLVNLRASGVRLSEDEINARIGDAPSAPAAQLTPGGVAVLPLFGVVAQRMDMMTAMSGGTSTERMGAQIDAALANPDVRALVLNVDSPGGTIEGVPELARRIFDARGAKPIVAIANATMASAAYWIGSAADEVVVTPSGTVGSIGVYTVHTDTSKADEQAGVAKTVIRAGRFKAEGIGGLPLSDEARTALQDRVDEFYGMFVNDVARQRGVTAEAVRNGYGQGAVLGARGALAAGLVDRIATLDETVARLARPQARSAIVSGRRVALEQRRVALEVER